MAKVFIFIWAAGMVAGGSQIVVFTTGRGTPVGSAIAPVIKITANRETFRMMKDDLDLEVSGILDGKESVNRAGERIYRELISAASGKAMKAEINGHRDFSMFKINISI